MENPWLEFVGDDHVHPCPREYRGSEADDLEREAMLRIAQALPRMRKTDVESVRALISRVL